MILSFGKHAGKDITMVPTDYLDWLKESNEKTLRAIQAELDRREQMASANSSWMEQVVTAGLKNLAMKHHPDKGGKVTDMQEINAAAELLKDFAKKKTQGVI